MAEHIILAVLQAIPVIGRMFKAPAVIEKPAAQPILDSKDIVFMSVIFCLCITIIILAMRKPVVLLA